MKVTSLRYLDAKFHHPSPKIKKIPKSTNGRLAIPALAGLLVFDSNTFHEWKNNSMLAKRLAASTYLSSIVSKLYDA